jgi:DNA (cytosine-5)-methyltransferase 1
VTWADWARIYAYDTGQLRDPGREPLPTQTSVEGDGLLAGPHFADFELPDVEECLSRMLEPHEIAAGMAFAADYIVLGTKRQRVQGLGNAVTPPAAEVIVSALVECITGEDIAAG